MDGVARALPAVRPLPPHTGPGLAVLEKSGPETAIEEINNGLEEMRKIFVAAEAEEQFEADELVVQLRELKESLRTEYKVGPTLAEQLAEAVAAEEYERAARLRDEIARRHVPQEGPK